MKNASGREFLRRQMQSSTIEMTDLFLAILANNDVTLLGSISVR